MIDFSLGSVHRIVYSFRVLCVSIFMLEHQRITQTHYRNSQIASDVAELDEIDVLSKLIRLSTRIDKHADL